MDNTQELLGLVHVDQTGLTCNEVVDCPYKERTISYALGVQIPTPGQDPEEIFKECCYKHYVFADANSSEDFKNDYSGFYHQRQLTNETCNFFLVKLETSQEYALNNETYGNFFGFGFFSSNPNLKGYLVRWKKVLAELGEGNYKIIKRITVASVPVEYPSIVFTLRQFSSKKADRTARIDVVMNGRLEKSGISFLGTAWKHSIRVPGFFGRRQPGFEEDNLVKRNFEKKQISMKQTNEYKFQTNLIPDCLTNEIFDFMLLANDIYLNDYNSNNHSYNFVKFAVKLGSNDDVEYRTTTRKARVNITFTDKFENNLKRNFN